jgi:glycosyltransferase involved in cell wall biosynthesis
VLHARLVEKGLPMLSLPVRNHFDVLAGLRLRRLVRARQYDIVHFHTARAHALSPWLHGLKTKRVVTRRMDYPLRKGWTTRQLYHHSVDMIVAISQGVRKALLDGGLRKERIRLIPSGIDTAYFASQLVAREQLRKDYDIAPDLPVALSVGALVERKGHSILLTAARQLKTQGYEVRYLICGEGKLRSELEAQTRTAGLTQEVRFIGFRSDVAELLAAADYFIHVPLHEGLGVAVLEALAAGLPTVASKVGGIPELIEDEKTGLLVPPHDATALATALVSLLRNKQFAKQLGRTGQTFVRSYFDISVMARANETLYLELLADTL